MFRRRGSPLAALALILIGAWLLAQNFHVPLPNLGDLWPVLLIVLGLACVLNYLFGGRKDSGLIFIGVILALSGCFFAPFTLGAYLPWQLSWADMGHYWPVFFLIIGAAFLTQWLFNVRQRAWLPAILLLVIGAVALFFTLGLSDNAAVREATRLWPVILIVIGLGLLLGNLIKPQASN